MRKSHLYKLLHNYLKGKSTADESQFIQRYLNFLEKGFIPPSLDATEKERIKTEMNQRLKAKLSLGEIRPARRLKWKYYAAAACALFVLFFSYDHLKDTIFQRQGHELLPVLASELSPLENKAQLILEDGRVILLDNQQELVSIGQHDTLIKKEIEGKESVLSYELTLQDAPENQEVAIHTMVTPKGGRYTVQLADGSRVWLNSDSKLRFPSSFSGKERRVELIGEGYFEVAKNKDKPFIIQAKGVDIEVLGTHFNVKGYADEAIFQTTLLEGSIKVSNTFEQLILLPGEQVEQTTGSAFVKKTVNVDEAVAWKEGYFYFKNDSIEQIMRMISRNYDVDILYQGDFDKMRFGGKVSINRSLSSLLEMIALTENVQFKQEGRRVIVMN